jgi:hypothetical protein
MAFREPQSQSSEAWVSGWVPRNSQDAGHSRDVQDPELKTTGQFGLNEYVAGEQRSRNHFHTIAPLTLGRGQARKFEILEGCSVVFPRLERVERATDVPNTGAYLMLSLRVSGGTAISPAVIFPSAGACNDG